MTGMLQSTMTASGIASRQIGQRLLAVFGLLDLEGKAFKDAARHLAHHAGIVGNQGSGSSSSPAAAGMGGAAGRGELPGRRPACRSGRTRVKVVPAPGAERE